MYQLTSMVQHLHTNVNYECQEQEEMAKSSAIAAGVRADDVYMGVDVFGRNTFGGGGFQVCISYTNSGFKPYMIW